MIVFTPISDRKVSFSLYLGFPINFATPTDCTSSCQLCSDTTPPPPVSICLCVCDSLWGLLIIHMYRVLEVVNSSSVCLVHFEYTNVYRMAGHFCEVLIFVIFVVDLAVTKISTHEN